MTARAYSFGDGMTARAYYLGDGMTARAYYLGDGIRGMPTTFCVSPVLSRIFTFNLSDFMLYSGVVWKRIERFCQKVDSTELGVTQLT